MIRLSAKYNEAQLAELRKQMSFNNSALINTDYTKFSFKLGNAGEASITVDTQAHTMTYNCDASGQFPLVETFFQYVDIATCRVLNLAVNDKEVFLNLLEKSSLPQEIVEQLKERVAENTKDVERYLELQQKTKRPPEHKSGFFNQFFKR
ncbi:MAG TPA: hypothetical protein VJB65_03895 [Patescibacteria group bacterium]|nr:hypothetical protein [Patescibacteria group bacterium]